MKVADAGETFLDTCTEFTTAERCDHFAVHRAWVALQRANGGRCPQHVEAVFARTYAEMEAAGPALTMRQDVELLDLLATVNSWLAELD